MSYSIISAVTDVSGAIAPDIMYKNTLDEAISLYDELIESYKTSDSITFAVIGITDDRGYIVGNYRATIDNRKES
jgi:hypothetical protein